MAQTIKIKRSSTTGTPAQLSNGEFAWTESGNVLFIGSYSGTSNIPIAGKRTPGVLTANQAIVTDGSGMIDVIKLGNSTVNAVINSSSLSLVNSTVTYTLLQPTAAQVTSGNYFPGSNGVWQQVVGGTTSPGGANTNLQFNDSGTFAGDASLDWDKVGKALTVGNSTVNVVVNSTNIAVGSNAAINQTQISFGNSTINSYMNSIATVFNGGAVISNSSGHYSGANVFLDTVRGSWGNTTVNATVNSIGLALNGTSVVVNNVQIAVGANVSVTTAQLGIGNTTANLFANSILVKVANSTSTVNITPFGLTVGTTTVNGTQITVAGGPTINATAITTTDLIATGNLTVSGTLTTIDTTNLNVKDSIIFLADQNANQASFTDVIDMGFVGQYGNTSVTQYTGFFRDASSTGKLWKLVDSTAATPAPTTTYDTSNTAFAYGILQTWLKCTGNVQGDGTGVFTVNTAGINAVANSTWYLNMVANTLTLSTPLVSGSGGTGQTTWVAGDLLYGNSTPSADRLARGSDGMVLQSNSTTILWGNIDGGTF